MTAEFYEPWSKNMHITKFAKHLDNRQEYLSTTGIKITDDDKLQFYLEQMIDSTIFSKQEIVAGRSGTLRGRPGRRGGRFLKN